MDAPTPSPRLHHRNDFRKLLVHVSERLDENAVTQVAYLRDVPLGENGNKRGGLDVLMALEKKGLFSPTNSEPLVKLLRDINRHEIAEYVKTEYQEAHKPLSRATSLPPNPSPKLATRRDKRSHTLSSGCIEITVSGSDPNEGQTHILRWTPSLKTADNGSPVSEPLHDVSLDGCAQYPEPKREVFTNSTADEEDGAVASEAVNPLESKNGEIRPRANTVAGRSQSSKDEDMRNRSCSEGTRVKITVKHNYMSPPSPPRSRSYEKLHSKKETHNSIINKSMTFPNKDVKCLKKAVNVHPPLSISRSAPGNMYHVLSNTTLPDGDEFDGKSVDSNSSGALMMSTVVDEEEVVQPNIPATDVDTRSQSSSLSNLTKKVSRKLKIRKARSPSTERSSRERSSHHAWSVTRKSLLQSIWNHGSLDCMKCSEPVPIDIECGSRNPHLLLHLYPYGLFDDKNKSMTLLVKVVIPDDCPPIPSNASFSLTWEIFKVEKFGAAKKFVWSRKTMNVTFATGTVYLRNFLQHNVLQQHNCKRLEINVHLKTTYSVYRSYNNTTVNDISNNDTETMHSDEMLLSFKNAVGNLKLASEIGQAYFKFGCSLLDDEDGTVTNGIAEDLKHDAVAINQEILGVWLQGKGRQPVQWCTLINTLGEIDMHDLASRIEQNLKLS